MSEAGEEVAIPGGSGFIGTRLADRLETSGRGHRLCDIRWSPAGKTVLSADVTDPDTLLPALRGCRAVVNLAAEHRDDVRPVSRYQRVNVTQSRIAENG